MNMISGIEYGAITQIPELQDAVELQKTVWAQETITSMPQMAAAILHGGTVIGAYDGTKLIGFCYGFAGYNGKETYLASHMMAINPDYRDRGIGMNLKLEQRLIALESGYRKIIWTYDPFETRNGYLNIYKLGGTVYKYIPAFYGKDQQLFPIDRFMVEWDLQSDRVKKALSEPAKQNNNWINYPSLLSCEIKDSRITTVRHNEVYPANGTGQPICVIPVPGDARQLKQNQPSLFILWQGHLRRLCTEYFSRNYRIVSFIRLNGPLQYYVLEVEQ